MSQQSNSCVDSKVRREMSVMSRHVVIGVRPAVGEQGATSRLRGAVVNWRHELWLFLSAYGVMFALFSFMHESEVFSFPPGPLKGIAAFVTGFVLYVFFARADKPPLFKSS